MKAKRVFAINLMIVLAMLCLSAWAWVHLPAGSQVPVHFGATGVPDRYAGKSGLLEMPLLTALVSAFYGFIPKIEPLQKNILRSEKAYSACAIATTVFLGSLHTAIVFSALGWAVDMASVVNVGLGILFIVLGNYASKIRRNYLFGFRTPWTLASDLSWHKTHRLGGWLLILNGLAFLIVGLLPNATSWPIYLPIGGVLISFLAILPAYSYQVWRRDSDRSST